MNNKKINVEIEEITEFLSELVINESTIIKAVKIQKIFRGFILRLKRLPLIMYKIQKYLKLKVFQFSTQNKDGRINSCIDEDKLIKLLIKKFYGKIKKAKIRMWYDILAFDNMYGWIPINIKTTNTKTYDNAGNLTICVQSYTNKILDINKSYKNGDLSYILFTPFNI